MWKKENRRGTFDAQFSISEWKDAPTEQLTTYDVSESTTDQPDTPNTSSAGEMNIDSIYDAIKTETKDDDISSKGHLFDSTLVHADVDISRDRVHSPRKASIAHHTGHALKKFTRRTTEISSTVPSSNSESLYAPTSSNISTRLLGGNDELWDKGDVYEDSDDEDSAVLEQSDCTSSVKSCSRSCYLETRHFFTTLARYPYIICISFLVFVFVMVAGMAAIQSERGRYVQQMKSTADFVVREALLCLHGDIEHGLTFFYPLSTAFN